MKVIIAGSRNIATPDALRDALADSGFDVSEVVSGGARGVDQLGEWWAAHEGLPVKVFKADWKKHGRAAGPIRNRQMAEYADALLAIWDGESPGTKNMIEEAQKRGLKVHVHNSEVLA